MYYIYHIPGVKIGCTNRYPKRCIDQGYDVYELLETHDCIDTASNRELELQKEYGYKQDVTPYKHILNNMSSLGGQASRSITLEEAEEIRDKYSRMKKYGAMKQLGEEYNIHRCVVYKIVNNKSYIQ